jgi:hypothetical protein
VNTLYCLEEWLGEEIISPPGDNFSRGKNYHWWTTLPLGSKFAPRGEVKNVPQMRIKDKRYQFWPNWTLF